VKQVVSRPGIGRSSHPERGVETVPSAGCSWACHRAADGVGAAARPQTHKVRADLPSWAIAVLHTLRGNHLGRPGRRGTFRPSRALAACGARLTL